MILRVLVACEESQAVCKAFRARGHWAYSCDVIECSGGHPEWHIKQDVLPLLNGNCVFYTCDGSAHIMGGRWDIIIAHPPCTDLAASGAAWFAKKREDGRQLKAIKFFAAMLNADCDRICVENPTNIIGGKYIAQYFPEYADIPTYTQAVQPYQFGHPVRKKTCLWLKGLPPLKPTNIVQSDLVGCNQKNGFRTYSGNAWYCTENGKILPWNDPRTARIRSKTYQGIADAMAEQWG